MDLRFSDEDEVFRNVVREVLESALQGEMAAVRGRGGPGDHEGLFDARLAFERLLSDQGWNCLSWPRAYGGRALSLMQEVIFFEEYARARAPGRLGHIGETLLGPTLIALGSETQKKRFLPSIVALDELWCQGFSEPGAGSDLAAIRTRAERRGDRYFLHGQKVWTSHAQRADFCFVLARSDPKSVRHAGLTMLMMPMRQAGVTVRPIVQLTGEGEFCEVFFDHAEAAVADRIGAEGDGWKVAMTILTFERGASTLAQQLQFGAELDQVIAAATAGGAHIGSAIHQRIAQAHMELAAMRIAALRMLSGSAGVAGLTHKLTWASWHRRLGELAMDVLGCGGDAVGEGYDLSALQRLFLFSRADTIYAGSNQIQRSIIAERALGLPKDPWRQK
jgi:alkylation response protein AidB-like acyl-CoA dehydrogenase